MDKQIHNRIMCECGEYAILYFSTIAVCGKCAMKLHNYKNKKIAKELEEARKCLE